MPLNLLSTHALTFYRPAEGFYSGGQWYEGALTTIGTRGSLQPYREGYNSMVLPDGARTEDARVYLSITLLHPASEFDDKRGDYCVIKGRQFEVKGVEDWTGYGLSTDHYKYLLVAVPQSTGGNQ